MKKYLFLFLVLLVPLAFADVIKDGDDYEIITSLSLNNSNFYSQSFKAGLTDSTYQISNVSVLVNWEVETYGNVSLNLYLANASHQPIGSSLAFASVNDSDFGKNVYMNFTLSENNLSYSNWYSLIFNYTGTASNLFDSSLGASGIEYFGRLFIGYGGFNWAEYTQHDMIFALYGTQGEVISSSELGGGSSYITVSDYVPPIKDVWDVFIEGGSLSEVLTAWNPSASLKISETFKIMVASTNLIDLFSSLTDLVRYSLLYVFREPASLVPQSAIEF